MSEARTKPEDIFYAIGFTRQDILSGTQLRSLQLSSKNQKALEILHGKLGALAYAAERGLLVKKLIEVYFLDSFAFGEDETFKKKFGNKYQVVEFFNEIAHTLSNQYKIQLPPVIDKLTKAELSRQLGISMRTPAYIVP